MSALEVAVVTLGAVFAGSALWMAFHVGQHLILYYLEGRDRRRDATINADQYREAQQARLRELQTEYREHQRLRAISSPRQANHPRH